jgi:hypothetical protein
MDQMLRNRLYRISMKACINNLAALRVLIAGLTLILNERQYCVSCSMHPQQNPL